MPLLGAVGLGIAARRINQRNVVGDLLTGSRSGQEAEHNCQILHGRHQPFDAHNRDVDRRQAGDHPPVALVRHQAKRPGLRHAEIHSRESNLSVEEHFTQAAARSAIDLGDVRRDFFAQFVAQGFGNLLFRQMKRGGQDMCRRFAPKLHNVLAQVGLHGPNARRRKGLIEADLFRKH